MSNLNYNVASFNTGAPQIARNFMTRNLKLKTANQIPVTTSSQKQLL